MKPNLCTPIHCIVGILSLGLVLADTSRAENLYRPEKNITLQAEKSFGSMCIDETARRLYVTGDNKVTVIDMYSQRVFGQITNVNGICGTALAPKYHRVFFSRGNEGKMSIVDLRNFKALGNLPTGKNPGPMLLEPTRSEIYCFNRGDNSASVFEADDGDFEGTVRLSGRPECAIADPKANRVYCATGDKAEIVAIDSRSRKVVSRWPVAPGELPSTLAIDPITYRLFVGCHNKLIVVLDTRTGKSVTTIAIGDANYAIAFDTEKRLLFSSNADGTLTIAREENPDAFPVVQTLETKVSAGFLALDGVTHRIYLAAANCRFLTKESTGQNAVEDGGKTEILVYGTAQN
jgi:DNA-binding beta-propeller fold protein YncE